MKLGNSQVLRFIVRVRRSELPRSVLTHSAESLDDFRYGLWAAFLTPGYGYCPFIFSACLASKRAIQRSGSSLNAAAQPEQQT